MAGELTPSAVMAAVDDIMCQPWAWGAADCCTAACDVFMALHGVDPMALLRGRYSSRAEAARIVSSAGGFPALAEHMARRSGLVPVMAVPGAIGISHAGDAKGPGRRAMMICIQPGIWAGKTADGYAMRPRAEWGWTCAGY